MRNESKIKIEYTNTVSKEISKLLKEPDKKPTTAKERNSKNEIGLIVLSSYFLKIERKHNIQIYIINEIVKNWKEIEYFISFLFSFS